MSNPTLGALRLSDGLTLKECSPSFIWSNDSRFLAVPQLSRCLGIFFGERILVIDTMDRAIFASPRYRGWLQPEVFDQGELVVVEDPAGAPRRRSWRIPEKLGTFDRLSVRWR